MEKNKILFVAFNFFCPEYLDGGNKIIFNLLRHLNNEPLYDIHFHSLHKGKIDKEFKNHFNNISVSFANSFTTPLLLNIKKALNWFFFYEPRVKLPSSIAKSFALEVEKLAKDYDAVHLTSLALASLADFLTKETLDKTILSAVDCYAMYVQRKSNNEKSRLKKFLGHQEFKRAKSFEESYYPKFKSVVFVSDVDLTYALKHFNIKNNLHSIPLGVNTQYFVPGNPQDEERNTIIFTGNMTYPPNKDASLFLINEVYPLVKTKIPEIKIIIAGNNPPEELICHASESIEITGRVPDLRLSILKAGLFVCPLRFGAGMKYKILEAMALEKTILCSQLSVDGIRNESVPSCHVINGFSPQEWADTIIELLNKRENLNRPRNSIGRDLIKSTYSWKAMKVRYTSLYRQARKS